MVIYFFFFFTQKTAYEMRISDWSSDVCSLEAFLHEYRIAFPVGVDAPGEPGGLPITMARYGMQGTPTLVLIDRKGHRRAQHFGHVPALRLGADILALTAEAASELGRASCRERVCPSV